MKEMVEKAFESSQEAIRKAESATEKRFESVNEFRAVLTDQQQHLVSRQVLDSVSDKLTAAIDRNRDDLDQLSKRLDLREGQEFGHPADGGDVPDNRWPDHRGPGPALHSCQLPSQIGGNHANKRRKRERG